MNRINVNNVLGNSKFNSFFLATFILSFFIIIFDGFDMAVFGSTLPSLLKDWGLSPAQGGVFASVATTGMIVGSVIIGFFADRYGRKTMLVVGIIAYSIFTGMCGMVTSLPVFVICRFFAGVGIASVVPLVSTIINEYSPKKNRNLMGIATYAANAIGMALVFFVALIVISRLGWQAMYLLGLVGLVLLLFFPRYPESMSILLRRGQIDKVTHLLEKADPNFKKSPDDEYTRDDIGVAVGKKVPVLHIFQGDMRRMTILITIVMFFNFWVNFGMSTWMPQLMGAMNYNLPGLLFTSVYYLGAVAGLLCAGTAANKFGIKIVLALCLIGAAVLVLIATYPMDQTVFTILLFFVGALININTPMGIPFATQCFPIHMRGAAMGTVTALGRIGSVVSPIVIGVFVGMGWPAPMIFRLFMIPLLIVALCLFLIKGDPSNHTKAAQQDN